MRTFNANLPTKELKINIRDLHAFDDNTVTNLEITFDTLDFTPFNTDNIFPNVRSLGIIGSVKITDLTLDETEARAEIVKENIHKLFPWKNHFHELTGFDTSNKMKCVIL